MKRLILSSIFLILLSSCSKDIYKVVKYSGYNQEKDQFYSYKTAEDQYYVISHNDYYYILNSDSIIHYRRLSYEGKIDGYDRTIAKLDNGEKVILDAVMEQGYFNDKYVYVNVIDFKSRKKLYSFVLDWDNKLKKSTARHHLEKIE